MSILIISTMTETDTQSDRVIKLFGEEKRDFEIIFTENYRINHCIGCTDCWLKTPGICAIKDDFEVLFKKFLKADYVVLTTESKLGFISYKMKNIVDRLIPLAIPYTELHNGEMRHVSRYKKCWNIGLLFSGDGNKEYLDEWMERFALNFFSKSLGAYSIEESEGLFHELSGI